jgi:hypothetical protein
MTHPITPPPELLQLWFEQHYAYNKGLNELLIEVARYGADQELEACCEYVYERLKLTTVACIAQELRAARRPKPPSLKEQALDALERYTSGKTVLIDTSIDTIRRALEALPND